MCHFCTNFAHIIKVLTIICNGKFCPKFVTSYTFVMTNFVPSLSHLTCIMTNFVPSLSHLTFVMINFVQFLSPVCPRFVQFVTNFLYNYSFLCIKLYIYAYFDILSHFLSHFCHMGQILSLFWHPRNPVIPRVFTFGQKFVTFSKILSPVCHVFVTSINRITARFIHKIYINVTNIYKSLTKFF